MNSNMKAIVYTKYGPPDVLQLTEVEKPSPSDDEVLVRVHASSVNYNTLLMITGEPVVGRLWTGLLKPKSNRIPGNDIAGRVEAVGRNVSQFQPGDEVYADIADCGHGAFAEYLAVPESALAPKPVNLSFAEAAAVPEAAVVALQGLRDKGQLQPGQKVLIVGASGGIGTFAVQIAKAFGAEVTGVCSTRNLDMVRSIGADRVIDYTKEDFATNGQQYDLILATAGYRPLRDYKRVLAPDGIYVATGGKMRQIFEALLLGGWMSRGGNQQMGSLTLRINTGDLLVMKELIEAGQVVPVIDRCYPLAEAAEALRYYAQGRSRGKVIITVGEEAAG